MPEPLLAALRERAAAHGRSLDQEVLAILDAATAEPIPQHAPSPNQLVTAQTSMNTMWRRKDIYGDEGR